MSQILCNVILHRQDSVHFEDNYFDNIEIRELTCFLKQLNGFYIMGISRPISERKSVKMCPLPEKYFF